MPLQFISNQFNFRIKNLFKKFNYNVQVANKSTNNIRQNLSKTLPKFHHKCNKRKTCPINGGPLCFKFNVIYKIKCKKCNSFYIGSTNEYLHDRVSQHLLNREGSLYLHLLNDHQLIDPDKRIDNILVNILYQCPSIKDLLPIEATLTKPHMGKPYLLNKKKR